MALVIVIACAVAIYQWWPIRANIPGSPDTMIQSIYDAYPEYALNAKLHHEFETEPGDTWQVHIDHTSDATESRLVFEERWLYNQRTSTVTMTPTRNGNGQSGLLVQVSTKASHTLLPGTLRDWFQERRLLKAIRRATANE